MARLAEVVQLIQQQQALEQRKEEGHQSMALNLLNMQMRQAENTQGILLKEYYDKKDEVRETEKMFDQYSNLSPKDVSQGGRDIISIVDNQNKVSAEAITQNLDALGSYQSELESSLGELRGQAQALREMQSDFSGANRVLEQHEYEAFQEHALQALDEGGLGWSTTAGADQAYYETDPEARFARALNVTEHMQGTAKTGAEGHYQVLRGIYTPDDDKDMVERLTYEIAGKEVEPSKEMIVLIQNMVGQNVNYSDFLSNLEGADSDPGLSGKIREELLSNPHTEQAFSNITKYADLITTLDNELAGINTLDTLSGLDQFASDIYGVNSKEEIFAIYDEATSNLEASEHAQFFNALEMHLGGIDAYPAYKEYKGLSSGANVSYPSFELDESLNLMQEQAIQETEYLKSIGQQNQRINVDPNYYIDDSFEQMLKDEGIE